MAFPGAGACPWSRSPHAPQPGATHLWLCDLDAVRDPALLDGYRRMLDADERRRMERFVFEHHRHRFLVSHALLRCVLSLYAERPPAEWRFVSDEHGKPDLAPEHRADGPAFNLSHSATLALLAVHPSRGGARLGVDLEFHRPARDFIALAHRNFAPAEAARLPSLRGESLAGEFYDLWTLKESFVKARGDGLRQSLADFWFGFDRAAAQLHFDAVPGLEPEPCRWFFWSYRLEGPFSAALALAATPEADAAEPAWLSAVPGQSWHPMQATCTLQGSRRITGI